MNDGKRYGSGEAATLNNLGKLYESSGDGHMALEYYVEALRIFTLNGDLDNKAVVLSNTGALLMRHGDSSGALDCFREVLTIKHKNGDRIGEVAALCDIATVYMNLTDFDAMLKFEQQALELIETEDNPAWEAFCRSGVAIALHGMDNTSEAIPYLEQSILLLERENLPCDAGGASIDDFRELLRTMYSGKRSEILEMAGLSNALIALVTAASWKEALQVFERYKPQLSSPELEASLEEGITQMRRVGARQQASNLQAHLKLLRRAKRHSSPCLAGKIPSLDLVDESEFDLLRKMIPESEWASFVEGLIKDIQHPEQLAWLYARENRWRDLMTLVQSRQQSSWRLEAYREQLESRFPEEITLLYEKIIDQLLVVSANRFGYKQVVAYLRRMKKLGQAARADSLIL